MDRRALIITRNFPPLVGGMERLVLNIFNELKAQYLCCVVGPKGCKKAVSGSNYAVECPVSPISAFLFMALGKSLACALKEKYSFCIAGSGVTAPVALTVKALFNIPVITFIHGLDLIADSWVYQQIFIPAIQHSDLVIANSRNTARLAVIKGVFPDKIKILFPGVKIPQLQSMKNEFRQRYRLEDKKILLSVGRLVPRKGIAEFLKYSFPKILEEFPEVVYIIIGSEPQNSLKKDGNVFREIQTIIIEKKLTNHVLLLGRVDEMILAQAYGASDLHILPSLEIEGDIEGFGMVAIEAAAYGLPTIGFAAGGIPDAVMHQYSGFLVEDNNYEELSELTINYLAGNIAEVTPENCADYAAQFSWDNYGRRLREICGQLISVIAK